MGRKHSEQNRFRFQTFSERINDIKIGVNAKIKRFDAVPEDAETFLGENLRRWSTLNCSNEFTAFERQLTPFSESLPLIYLHRQKIADLFQEHLTSATKLSQESILDLLVHFARDLSSEFGQFAPNFFAKLVCICLQNRGDPDVLEWAFSCMAHLMKLLWKYFVEDLETFLDLMMPTFETKLPAYIRQFSAESIAFLFRKSKDLLKTVEWLVREKLDTHSSCAYGFALILFEVVKGASNTLLPCTEKVVQFMLETCSKSGVDSVQIEFFQLFLTSVAGHVDVKSSALIFNQLLKYLQSTESLGSCEIVDHSRAFFSTWLDFRNGIFCSDANGLSKAVMDSLAWHVNHESCVDNLLEILTNVFRLQNNPLPLMQCYIQMKNLFDLPLAKSKLFRFVLEHVTSPQFSTCFLPHVLNFLMKFKAFEKQQQDEKKQSHSSAKEYDLCDLTEVKEPINDSDEAKDSEDLSYIRSSLLTILAKLAIKGSVGGDKITIPDTVIRTFSSIIESDTGDLAQTWAIAVTCNRFGLTAVSCDEPTKSLISSLSAFCYKAKNTLDKNGDDKVLARKLLVTLNEVTLCFPTDLILSNSHLDSRWILSIFKRYGPEEIACLQLAKTIVGSTDSGESSELYIKFEQFLESGLSSPVESVRKLSLEILQQLSRSIYAADAAKCVNVVEVLLKAENSPADLNYFKDRLNCLSKVRADIVANQPRNVNWKHLCIYSLCGQFAVNFTPVHRPVAELLASYAQYVPRNTFWEVFSKTLDKVHRNADQEFNNIELDDVDFDSSTSCTDLFASACNELKNCEGYRQWPTFRTRIWEAMKLFRVEDLEPCSRHYVPFYLKFVEQFFSNIISTVTLPTTNLLVAPASVKKSKKRNSSGSFAERRQCLVAMLSVFSKLKHRSQLFSAEQITATVFRLLKYASPDLQKPALDFLINTNWPGIAAFKEILVNLLDYKTYRNTLVELGDISSIIVSDRKAVLPVLLRIIFGQMHYVKNKKRSGKTGFSKKSAALGFLANLTPNEIVQFLEIVVEPFTASESMFGGAFSIDDSDFVESAMNSGLEVNSFLSLEMQFWFFHTLVDILNNLKNIAAESLRSLFRIALILYSISEGVMLQSVKEIDVENCKRLKRLKKLGFKCLSLFFKRRSDAFEEWSQDFSCVDISAFFDHVIWPEFAGFGENLTSGSELVPMLSMTSIWAADEILRKPMLTRKFNESETLISKLFAAINSTKVVSLSSSIDLTIVDCFIEFFDKLLPKLEIEEGEGGEIDGDVVELNAMIFQNRSAVIAVVSNILNASKKSSRCRKRVPKVLEIFQRVTANVDDPHCAREVFQLLIIMIASKSLPVGESQGSALKSLLEVVPALESVSLSQLNLVSMCFARVTDRQARLQLCELLNRLSEKLATQCSKVAVLVEKLNSWSTKLDEPDYESRMSAFSQCLSLLKTDELDPLEVNFLLNNCLYFLLYIEDFSIRANSSELIGAIIQWAKCSSDLLSSSSRKTVVNAVVSACSRGVQHKSEVVRHEFLRILGELVRVYPNHPSLAGLVRLTDTDPEADFFENMRHVQMHRRSRAMRKLAHFLEQQPILDHSFSQQQEEDNSSIGLRPLTAFILPIAQLHLLAAATGSVKTTMVDASLDLLRGCCRHLPWPSYYKLLTAFLNQLTLESNDRINFNIKAVVAILDAYHFVSHASQFDPDSAAPMEVVEPAKVLEPKQTDERPDSEVAVMRGIQSQIIPNIVEAINTQLMPGSLSNAQCAVIPLTVAAVRLLIHCPATYRTANVSTFILKILEFLKSRFLEVRKAARKALGQIVLALGPGQFGWIIRDLRIGLARGYQRHVLTFTIGDLVRTVEPHFQPGQLDGCIKDLSNIFCSELFTNLSEEKETDCKVAGKWPEARRRSGIHALPLLAKMVSKATVGTLLTPIHDVLAKSSNAEMIRKARQVLMLIVPILAQNPGIALPDLMKLARKWLQGTETAEETKMHAQETSTGLLETRPKPIYLLPPKPPRMGLAVAARKSSANGYINSEFGLKLIFSLIKHSRLVDSTVQVAFGGDDDEIDQFAGEVHYLMKVGENEAVLHAALQLASALLNFKVRSFTDRLKSLADSIFDLLKSELLQKNTQSRLLVACFKAAGSLIELVRAEEVVGSTKRLGLDGEQIDALLICIDEALIGDRQGVCALHLLKKVLDHSLRSQQLAEIMTGTVTKVSLKGQEDQQPLARACLLAYILHYPIGQKGIDNMINTFIGVLANENSDGWVIKSALEMLFQTASHYPEPKLQRLSASIFLPVAALFVNSKDVEIRELVNVVLVRLLSRTREKIRDEIFNDLVMKWFNSKKILQQQLSGHVIVAFTEAEGTKFESRLATVVPRVVHLLEENILKETKPEGQDGEDVERGDEETVSMLEHSFDAPMDNSRDGLIYSLITTLAKLVRQFKSHVPASCDGGFAQLLHIAESFSLHLHSWIRTQVCHLWFELFKIVEVNEFMHVAKLSVNNVAEIKTMCRRVVHQLLTYGISPEFSEKVAANFVFLSRLLLDTGDATLVLWLCHRIVRIALSESIHETRLTCVKRICVFKWMAVFASDLNSSKLKERAADFVSILVVPLARELSDNATSVMTPSISKRKDSKDQEDEKEVSVEKTDREDSVSKELTPVCQELSELFRNCFGVQLITHAWNEAVARSKERRLKRSAERASMAVTDPSKAARLKIYKQTSKREARKRRVAKEKVNRGATIPSKNKTKRLDK